jgi:SAM-dependent MidA family methyltransferase
VTASALATQGAWLRRLGIDARLQSLAAAAPGRADELQGQRDRLVEPKAMGDLFKAMAFTAPHWPTPAGFEGDAA